MSTQNELVKKGILTLKEEIFKSMEKRDKLDSLHDSGLWNYHTGEIKGLKIGIKELEAFEKKTIVKINSLIDEYKKLSRNYKIQLSTEDYEDDYDAANLEGHVERLESVILELEELVK